MPGARAAVQATRERRVGLLATEATVRSNAYQNALNTLDAGLEVFAVACPRLASLIQEGDVFSDETEGAAREGTAPLKAAGVDTVILGCTHYPLITPMLRRLLGPQVLLINSAEETAREVGEILVRKSVRNDRAREGDYRFLTTGDPQEFREVGARFLQLPIREVERI
jgi:glutamate racemase